MSNVILVSFDLRDLSRKYAYFTDYTNHFVGQLVVVSAGGEFKIVTVAKADNIKPTERAKASAWIVQPIDIEGYLARVHARLKGATVAPDVTPSACFNVSCSEYDPASILNCGSSQQVEECPRYLVVKDQT